MFKLEWCTSWIYLYHQKQKLLSIKEAEACIKKVAIKVTSGFSGTDLLPNIAVYVGRKDMDWNLC